MHVELMDLRAARRGALGRATVGREAELPPGGKHRLLRSLHGVSEPRTTDNTSSAGN